MMLRTNVSWRRGIHALVLAGAILVASGGGSALAAPSCAPSGLDTVCTFSTPGPDTFTVPAGVTGASFDVFGAQGGSVSGDFTVGGLGGRASAELALTPGATVTVVVGGTGGGVDGCGGVSGAGGSNGGAAGGGGVCTGAGGGGASDVRIGGSSLSDRALVAGGGGGAANSVGMDGPAGGGGGGGPSGQAGGPSGTGGSGGDQTGTSGSGQPGNGSPGADGNPDDIGPVAGGGGGGGYYGGAGGANDRGGGGGSGFGPPGVVFETGVRSGDGLVAISYRTPVSYSFGGFRQPVDNPPIVNTGRAGRTYPVKFQVRDQSGALVTSLAAVSSVTPNPVACGEFTGVPIDVLETTAVGGTSLRVAGDEFIYNWKTPTTAGCYELFVTLADGSVHSANFSLN